MNDGINELHQLTDNELLERVTTVLASERAGLARLIGYLAEVEDRRLHLFAADSSMFDFCTRRLALSEGEERAFGKEHVADRIYSRQRKSAAVASAHEPEAKDATYDKLLSALTGLGFRPKQARAVLDLMRDGKSRVPWTAPLDQLLREAAQLLTR
jgi:hypothetical protein